MSDYAMYQWDFLPQLSVAKKKGTKYPVIAILLEKCFHGKHAIVAKEPQLPLYSKLDSVMLIFVMIKFDLWVYLICLFPK